MTLVILLFMILTGCISKQVPRHPDDIPVNNLNTAIQILAPKEWNNFKINKPVDLQIINISDKDIVFLSGFDKELFLIQDGQLVKIEDTMLQVDATVTFSDGPLIINDDTLAPGESTVLVFKVLLENELSVVRIYVKGKYKDTEESVSGYLDIVLKP